jgi:DTW domain-containing protein YfiP
MRPSRALTWHARPRRSFFKCPGCWLAPALCVCSALARRAPPSATAAASASATASAVPPHRLAVLMHHKEHGRAANTGCLLAPSLGARIYVSGVAAQERALTEALDAAGPHGAAVLWPGDGAITLDELRSQVPDATWQRGLTLLAVDATWGSARKLQKRVPPWVPRITLPPGAFAPGRSLLFPVRKYAGPRAERFCTYEAAIALLYALGTLGNGDDEAERERDRLLLNIKMKVDALLKHKNRRAAYAEETGDALAAAQAALLEEMMA